MDLNSICFILIVILFIEFLLFEGFNIGVGILLPFITKKDKERTAIIKTIGTFWHGNEMWLLMAGGVIFVVFPTWYKTIVNGFYLILILAIVALIFKGISINLRSVREGRVWKNTWDSIIFCTSFLLAIIWAVAIANLIKGIPIEYSLKFIGRVRGLSSLFTVMAGLTTLLFLVFNGATFLSIKVKGNLLERVYIVGRNVGMLAMGCAFMLMVLGYVQTEIFTKEITVILGVMSLIAILLAVYIFEERCFKWALFINGVVIILSTVTLFTGLFPNLMVSTIDTAYNLTISQGEASQYTLSLMTKSALIIMLLIFQGWTLWILKKRLSSKCYLE